MKTCDPYINLTLKNAIRIDNVQPVLVVYRSQDVRRKSTLELELDKHETAPERSEYAGIGARFVASLLDGLILGIPAYIFHVRFNSDVDVGKFGYHAHDGD